MTHPELLAANSLQELQVLAGEYPYCQAIQLAYLKCLHSSNDIRYQSQLKRVALQFPDRALMEKFINTPVKVVERKSETADTTAQDAATANRQEYIVLQPTEYHIDDEPSTVDAGDQQSVIDRFLRSDYHARIPKDATDTIAEMPELPEVNVTDGILTESLARIYIKQKKYDKALNIFRKLNLKYPEKSSYFADQIRFLEKIVQNAN